MNADECGDEIWMALDEYELKQVWGWKLDGFGWIWT